jgi:hypothetical protein
VLLSAAQTTTPQEVKGMKQRAGVGMINTKQTFSLIDYDCTIVVRWSSEEAVHRSQSGLLRDLNGL